MWYRDFLTRLAQTSSLPIVTPAPVNNPGIAPIGQQEFPQDIPAGAAMPPELPQDIFPEPPLHDRCHCKIKTMPGGRKIWEFSENACQQCRQIGEAFNAYQASIFGI